jgi:NAD+ diphosphatase
MNTRFQPAIVLPSLYEGRSALWFVFQDSKMLVWSESPSQSSHPSPSSHSALERETPIPCAVQATDFGVQILQSHYMGTLDGIPCFAGEVEKNAILPETLTRRDLRSFFVLVESELWSIAGRAFQIIEWDRTTKFCGRCGTHTQQKTDERAKECPACGFTQYPRVTPAAIMLVWREREGVKEFVLSRSPHFPKGMFSVQAGFVDAGESLEECVRREVFEETGLHVGALRYFGSQSWPFPHSLMVGFIAEYESGEIAVDGVELEEAAWYSVHSMPTMPPSASIARQMIDWFVAETVAET